MTLSAYFSPYSIFSFAKCGTFSDGRGKIVDSVELFIQLNMVMRSPKKTFFSDGVVHSVIFHTGDSDDVSAAANFYRLDFSY